MNHLDDYVQMLIAARWIKAEDVDDEYQAYCKRVSKPETYRAWSLYREDWSNLDAQYKAEIQRLYDLHPDGNIGRNGRIKEKELLDAMGWIEVQLGY